MSETIRYKEFTDLPLMLNAEQLAKFLNISRANAYTLMHTKGFPTITIQKRMVVYRDALYDWIQARLAENDVYIP